MAIKYRQGKKADCKTIAEMINIASDGVVEYLFHDLVPETSAVEVVAHDLENDNYPDTYKNALVAYDGDDLVGMALSFPSSYNQITDEMKSFLPADRLEYLSDFYACQVENSWFLDALCVIESYRRQGIGQKLISLTKEKAINKGYNAMSLMVFTDNALAISLYQHTGFEVVQKVKLQGNKFIHHQDGCLLMKCEIIS